MHTYGDRYGTEPELYELVKVSEEGNVLWTSKGNMVYRCMHCSTLREASELQTIESIFCFDAEAVSKLVGKKVEGKLGTDTMTLCNGACAQLYRANSAVIIRDEPFQP